MIFPVLDVNGSGVVDVDEFIAFCKKAESGLMAGSGMRAAFNALAGQIRGKIRQTARDKGKSVQEVFRMFDTSGDNVIDKDEFRVGCQALKISISAQEVELIWPVRCCIRKLFFLILMCFLFVRCSIQMAMACLTWTSLFLYATASVTMSPRSSKIEISGRRT